MSKVLILFIVLISMSAIAKKPKKQKYVPRPPSHSAAFLTDARMGSINLANLQIIDSGFNDLRYQFHPVGQVSKDVENVIFKHSGNRVISQIYQVSHQTMFQGVYLYVAKVDIPLNDPYIPKSQYVLTELYINHIGSSFVSRYYITAGNANSLIMFRYKKDSLHTAKNPTGGLFLN